MFAVIDPFLLPVHDLVEGMSHWLPMPLCIVLLTVIVRLAIHPLNRATYRAGLHRRRLSPQIRELQERHRRNPERLRTELMELHTREGVSPAAGCLPTLLQLPVFAMVYRLFSAPQLGGQANALLHHTFSGVPLTAQAVTAGSGIWVFGLLVVVALLVGWLIKRQTRAAMVDRVPAGGGDSPQSEVAATMSRIMPMLSFGTVAAVLFLPLGTGLYLVASAIWTFLERSFVTRTVTV
jgi:YidC/Oxa1 family membrane protein insertase